MTQGKIVGARERLKGREKNDAGGRAPGNNVLPEQFQTVAADLACDQSQKTFVFFCQSEGSRPWSRFVCFYTQRT